MGRVGGQRCSAPIREATSSVMTRRIGAGPPRVSLKDLCVRMRTRSGLQLAVILLAPVLFWILATDLEIAKRGLRPLAHSGRTTADVRCRVDPTKQCARPKRDD